MRGLQIRQPFRGDAGENEMMIHLPTTDVGGVRVAFAVMNEGAADRIIIDYSVTSGTPTWITTGLNKHVFALSNTYQRIEVDFSFIEEVNDNPDFKIRIRFDGDHMSDDLGKRVTFNNMSVEAQRMPVSIREDGQEAPDRFELEQNVPNPFNPKTEIRWTMDVGRRARLSVYDLLGREVIVLADGVYAQGRHSVRFDASNLASGVYIYRLESGGQVETRKMVLIK